VRWIGFLHRPTGNASSIRRLDRIEGIYRMLEHCCAVPRLLSAMDVRHLAEWSADIHFFEFAIVDLDDAVSQINALAEEGDVQEAGYRHSRALPISSDSRGLQGGPIL
jgi:hypothetical protein